MRVIRLLAADVDGTLTDGGLYFDGSGNEFKRFDVQDGMGIALLRQSGVAVALISGRFSEATAKRAVDLRLEWCVNGVADKLSALRSIAEEMRAEPAEIAYMGDDVNDIECLEWAGLAFAPANAVAEVKAVADVVTSAGGGFGAVREAANHILARNGQR